MHLEVPNREVLVGMEGKVILYQIILVLHLLTAQVLHLRQLIKCNLDHLEAVASEFR